MNQRKRKLMAAAAWMLAAALTLGLLCGAVILFLRDAVPVPATVLIVAAALAAATLACLPWWRKLDHMQRDSHLSSWNWGGGFGGGLALLLILLFTRDTINHPLFLGAVLVIAAQTIGYAVALLYWRIAHRSPEA